MNKAKIKTIFQSKTVQGSIIVGICAIIAAFVGLCRRADTSISVKNNGQYDSSSTYIGDSNNLNTSIIKIGEQLSNIMFNGNPNTINISYNIPETETKKTIAYFEKKLEDMNSVVSLTHQELERLTIALKDLDQRTSEIKILSDGRSKFGNIVAGKPYIIAETFEQAHKYFIEKDYKKSYEIAYSAIQIYEKCEEETKKVFSEAVLTNSSIANIYTLGAANAFLLQKYQQTFEWINKANKFESNSGRISIIAITQLFINHPDDALETIDDGLKKYPNDPDLEKAKNLITSFLKQISHN